MVDKDDNIVEEFVASDGKTVLTGTVVATMQVSRQVLIDNSQSFKNQFAEKRWKDSLATTLDMEIDTLPSVEIVFRVLHDAMIESLHEVAINEIWEIIQYCDYRQVECSKLQPWFTSWIAKHPIAKLERDEVKQLLYPCYIWDNAKAFAVLTQKLAYEEAGHVKEINPTSYYRHHLDGNVIGK